MNELSIVKGVSCYEENGTVFLKLEDVAWGLGFTKTEIKDGKEYASVRWNRVFGFLYDLGFDHNRSKDLYIPENIFYRLAMKAKNERAEQFQALVADEIIPSIRKNGGYISGQERMSEREIMAKALLLAQNIIDTKQNEIDELKPKALFADTITSSETSVPIGTLAKLIQQGGVDMGQNRLFKWMRDSGYLISRKCADQNLPTQRAVEQGLFEVHESAYENNGRFFINRSPRVTAKGQAYFIKKFIK